MVQVDRNQQQDEVNIREANHVDILRIGQEKEERMMKVKVWEVQGGSRKWKRRKRTRRRTQARGPCARRLLLTSLPQRNGKSTN